LAAGRQFSLPELPKSQCDGIQRGRFAHISGGHTGETWIVDGGAGNDTITASGVSDADTTIRGGDGNDFIDIKDGGNLIV